MDIDKAYIMGQSYDDNAIYIGWSNLFDYTSVETLQASKQLPIPKKITMVLDATGVDLSAEINELLSIPEIKGSVKALKLLANIIRKAERAGGKINYFENSELFSNLLELLNNHEHYPISTTIAESAFKNAASANIYAVSHDIRNRDQAYTAISIGMMHDAAENSPKGNLTAKLNMLNPLTKYIMLHLNLVGKDVISVAANGEKVWFNAYYYWTHVLKTGGDISKLKFSLTLDRILGRASGNITPKTSTHLPDLNARDLLIKNILLSEFGATEGSLEYVYVDQLISLLLSAATDNAKELILAKINSGTNFARMYIYAIMMGYNLDDIVAFMTSPVSEFIDSMSLTNIFLNEGRNNNPASAINAANGIIGVKKFLHGTIDEWRDDPETGESYKVPVSKLSFVLSALSNLSTDLILDMRNILGLEEELTFTSLPLTMQALIKVISENPLYRNFNITSIVDTNDNEINSYLTYCLGIADKLKLIISQYKKEGKPDIEGFRADVETFGKLYNLSSEISSISSAWLGLNQGLPTSELDILKRFLNMSKVVSNREQVLGIRDSNMYEDSKIVEEDNEEDDWEVVSNPKKKRNKNYSETKLETIARILENNPTLTNVEERLDAAHKAGIINNFDIIKYLTDDNYREQVKDYYGLIMGTLNVFDMIEVIPHYKTIIEYFKSLVVANNTLSSKTRLINRLIKAGNISNVTDKQLLNIISYCDKLNIVLFTKELVPIAVNNVEGFDSYFRDTKTNKIELDTLNGLATFKHWIENEFKEWLDKEVTDPQSKLYNNGAIKHLVIVPNGDKSRLAMDIDLLNPDMNTISRLSYDEILKGMVELEKTNYNSEYTIADLLQLYNLVVNLNQYGGERLTTAFKVCQSPNNILNKYLSFISKLDYDLENKQEYNYIDFLINMAPSISSSRERFQTAKFIKVNDSVRGYIIKYLGGNNKYIEYTLVPPIPGNETEEEKLRRLENLYYNSTLEMPNTHNLEFMIKYIDYNGDFNNLSELDRKELVRNITNLVQLFSTSNKLLIFKDCK